MGKNKKKRKKDNIKTLNRKIIRSSLFVVALSLLIVSVGYLLFGTNLLKMGINSTTANYISFNDKVDSDTIRTDNLQILSDKKASKLKPIELDINSLNNNLEYEIVLIPITVSVKYKYIKYSLEGDNINTINVLDNTFNSSDLSGNVIYSGKLKKKGSNDKINLRVWIDENYDNEIGFNSFEVRIKLK